MTRQTSFSQAEFANKKKTTRREKFLGRMEGIIPWADLLAVIEPFYPKGERGRPPIGLERMLRVYFLQQWYGLADQAIEDAIYDSQAMRGFARIDLAADGVPDATTLLKFRRLLQTNNLCKGLFNAWPAKEQFIFWRVNDDRLDLAIADERLEGWESRSMFGGGAGFLLASVARLLRSALKRKNDGEQFPAGWLRGRFRHAVSIHCGLDFGEASSALAQLFSGEAELFCKWAQERIDAGARCVHAAIIQGDLEAIPQYNFRP